MSQARELMIAEYESLRQELRDASKRINDTVFWAVTASAGILGYAVQKGSPYIALLPLFVLFGGYRLVVQSFRTQRRIVAFLCLRYEGKADGPVWELALRRTRVPEDAREQKAYSRFRLPFAAQYEILWESGILSLLVSLVMVFSEGYGIAAWVLWCITALAWGMLALRMSVANRDYSTAGPAEMHFASQLSQALLEILPAESRNEIYPTPREGSDNHE